MPVSERERARRRAKRLAMTEAERELERAYFRAYYKANKDACRLRQMKYGARPEAKRKAVAKTMRYREKNREAYLAGLHSRRLLAAEDPRAVCLCLDANAVRFGGLNACERCGKPLSRKSATIDHIVPVALGGSGEAGNMQALCRPCNCSKNKTVADYRAVRV